MDVTGFAKLFPLLLLHWSQDASVGIFNVEVLPSSSQVFPLCMVHLPSTGGWYSYDDIHILSSFIFSF